MFYCPFTYIVVFYLNIKKYLFIINCLCIYYCVNMLKTWNLPLNDSSIHSNSKSHHLCVIFMYFGQSAVFRGFSRFFRDLITRWWIIVTWSYGYLLEREFDNGYNGNVEISVTVILLVNEIWFLISLNLIENMSCEDSNWSYLPKDHVTINKNTVS